MHFFIFRFVKTRSSNDYQRLRFWYEYPRTANTTNNISSSGLNEEICHLQLSEFFTTYLNSSDRIIDVRGHDKVKEKIESMKVLDDYIETLRNSMEPDLHKRFSEFKNHLEN